MIYMSPVAQLFPLLIPLQLLHWCSIRIIHIVASRLMCSMQQILMISLTKSEDLKDESRSSEYGGYELS